MSLCPLFICPEIIAAAQRVVEHAWQHPFSVYDLQFLMTHPERAPGQSPEFVCEIPIGYRCVFSIERQPFGWARHLSASLMSETALPSVEAMRLILPLFDFSWTLEQCGRAGLVFVMQEAVCSINILQPCDEPVLKTATAIVA